MKLIERKARTLALAVAMAAIGVPVTAGTKTANEAEVSQLRYDWLAPAASADNKTLSKRERRLRAWRIGKYGSGSYICSPSGFGKKSKCYSRRPNFN